MLLLLKRSQRDQWDPPGGKLKHGESPEEGILREMLEETGISYPLHPYIQSLLQEKKQWILKLLAKP